MSALTKIFRNPGAAYLKMIKPPPEAVDLVSRLGEIVTAAGPIVPLAIGGVTGGATGMLMGAGGDLGAVAAGLAEDDPRRLMLEAYGGIGTGGGGGMYTSSTGKLGMGFSPTQEKIIIPLAIVGGFLLMVLAIQR